MKIRHNPTLEKQIAERAREFLEKQDRAAGIHVSSLLTPRKYYWQQVDPLPLTDRDIGYFIAGRAHHEVVLAIMHKAGKVGDAPEAESKQWKEIWYTPDYRLGFLAEIKSTRKQSEPNPNDMEDMLREYKHYLKQLSMYMAVEDQERAALIVFYISLRHDDANKTTFPTTRTYTVTLSPAERESIRKEMVQGKNLINKALKLKDHTILPLCPIWMCAKGGFRGPAIKDCPRYDVCKPEGRYPLTEFVKARKEGEDD